MDNSYSSVTVSAAPTAGDIFKYKLYHAFVSTLGIIRLLISATFIAAGFATLGRVGSVLTLICLGIGALNPVITPMLYLLQAYKEAASRKCITYIFSKDKIIARDGEKRAELNWNELSLVVWLRSELLIYTTPYQALVLPRRQMEGKDDSVLRIIKSAANVDRTVYRNIF